MFIARHRRVTDPSFPFLKYARQNGFYMHLPRFWSCLGEDWDAHWKMRTSPHTFTFPDGTTGTAPPMFAADSEYAREASRDAAEAREAHARCRFPYLHRSYVGYASWVGERTSWTWFYQGNPYRPGSNLEIQQHEPRSERMTFHRGIDLRWHLMHLKIWLGRWRYRIRKLRKGLAARRAAA